MHHDMSDDWCEWVPGQEIRAGNNGIANQGLQQRRPPELGET
jgi:hypothetical protein